MAQKFNGNVEVGGRLLAETLESKTLGDELKEIIRRFIREYGEEAITDTKQNIIESLAEFERAFSLQRQILEQQFAEQSQKYQETKIALDIMAEKYKEAVTHFNKAIQTVNNLAERLTALEANYDPTIIR